jgi:hypothetical protein
VRFAFGQQPANMRRDLGDGLAGGDMQRTQSERQAALTAFTLVVVASSLIAADDAHACSCAEPGIEGPLPLPGALDVPRNTRIFLPYGGSILPSPVLVDDDGAETALVQTVVDAGDASIIVLTPFALLEAERSYTVRTTDSEREWAYFTTGLMVDDDPPPIPDVRVESTWSTKVVSSSTCGPGDDHGVSFSIDPIGEAVVVLVQTGGLPSEFDDNELEGKVRRVFPRTSTVNMGRGTCVAGWPEAKGSESESFVFAFIDEAGHFSGWSEPVEVTLPMTVPAFWCSHVVVESGTRPQAALASLALLSLLVIARRRRRYPSVSRPLR